MKRHMMLLTDIAYGIAAAAGACAIVFASLFLLKPTFIDLGWLAFVPRASELVVGLEIQGEGLVSFSIMISWLVAIFVWHFLMKLRPRIAYFMELMSVLGFLITPLLLYISAWHLFGFRSGGLAYDSIPVAPPHAVWLFMFPAMVLICIAWGLQSRDRAIIHGGVFALGVGIIMTALGVWLR